MAFSLIGGSHLSASKIPLPKPDPPSFGLLATQPASASTSDQMTVQDPSNRAGPFGLSKDQLLSLGYRMWHNYAGGALDGLTQWNGSDADHQFMYLGIAQNIWLPADSNAIFQADWPTVAGRLERGMDPSSPDLLLTGLTADQSALVQKNFNLVAHCSNPLGVYALIDYVNFKGEGRLGGTEEFNGQSWGVLQVLLNMQTPAEGASDVAVMTAFVQSAKFTLCQRIINHKIQDPTNNDVQYLDIWVTHLNNYLLTNDQIAAMGLDQAPAEVATDVSSNQSIDCFKKRARPTIRNTVYELAGTGSFFIGTFFFMKGILKHFFVGVFIIGLSLIAFWVMRSGIFSPHHALNEAATAKSFDPHLSVLLSQQQKQKVASTATQLAPTEMHQKSPAPLDHLSEEEKRAFPGGIVVEASEIEGPEAGQKIRLRILKTNFKYPFVRTEELINQQGVLRRSEMVADHFLVTLPPEITPAAFLKKMGLQASMITRITPDAPLYRIDLASSSLNALPRGLEKGSEVPGVICEPDVIAHSYLTPTDPAQ